MRPLYHSRPGHANDHAAESDQVAPGLLVRRVELRRTFSIADDSEYLAILIRKPLSVYDAECIQRMIAELDPTVTVEYRVTSNG